MKRGVKRGNSTIDPLSDNNTIQSANKRVKQKSKKPPQQSTQNIGDDSFISVSFDSNESTLPSVAYYKTVVDNLENQVRTLTVDIKGQQKQITELVSQLSFVTSWLENSVTPEQCSAAFKDFAAAVKRPAVDRSMQESAVAAVYVDNQRRLNRSTNFIVSGLPPSTIRPDLNAVVDLCRQEFNEVLDIVHCMRLGKLVDGRTQPLLIVLKTAEQALRIIKAAKNLRLSTDSFIRQNVYISANLTKAESRAAYEVRCERRQAAERRSKLVHEQQQQHHSEAPHGPRGSQAPASHQLQQSKRKPQPQEHHQTSNGSSASLNNVIQSEHLKQLIPPLPHVKPSNQVTTVEVHQPPSHLHQMQQHAIQQPQQWMSNPTSLQIGFASDPSVISSFPQQQWQQPQMQSTLLHQGSSVVPQPPSLSSSQNMICVDPTYQQHQQYKQPLQQSHQWMTSPQYSSGGAPTSSLKSLDPSASAFQVASSQGPSQFSGLPVPSDNRSGFYNASL